MADCNPRAYVFFDGQNLFNAAKVAFGYPYPNYSPLALTKLICARNDWYLGRVFFYTGVPSQKADFNKHCFWVRKLAYLKEYDVAVVFSQDQDFKEATDDVKKIAAEHKRWIDTVCVYPASKSARNKHGIFQRLLAPGSNVRDKVGWTRMATKNGAT